MTIDFTQSTLTLAEVYDFTLSDGTVANFTPHRGGIVFGATTYQAIPIKRGPISYYSNLQVDKLTIQLGLIGVSVGTSSYSIPDVIKRGFLRGTHIQIYLVDYEVLDQKKLLFDGWVTGGISYNAGALSLECSSLLDKLNERFPKLIYSEFCQHQLFDTRCSLSKDDYDETGTAGVSSTTQLIYSPVFAFSNHAEGYWLKGELKFTSGLNLNISRTINQHVDGYVRVILPFINAVVVSVDTFTAWPGCDKSGLTCATKFLTDNYANFFGFEYIPKPEILYG